MKNDKEGGRPPCHFSFVGPIGANANGREVCMITNCEFCAFYVYDEDGYAECEVNLDEDEMARFMSSSYDSCPYYQTDDEYKIVRKQN